LLRFLNPLDVYSGVTLAADRSGEAVAVETQRYITLYGIRSGFRWSAELLRGLARSE
jgi:hypothetical protein